MMVLALFSWWYTAGWAAQANRSGGRIERVLEAFSVGTLARTLFSPFRQISAGSVQGPVGVKMRAFGDRLFSRVFGAVIRMVFIIIGMLAALLAAIVGLVQIVLWPVVPLLPLFGIIAAAMGWTF